MTAPSDAGAASTYELLIELLDNQDVDYKLLDHEPVGTTDEVSRLRGHSPAQAAKCLVLVVKLDRRTRTYVLAVVTGNSKVDFAAVAAIYEARYVGFADAETAQRLARTVPGTVLPFPMDPDVELLIDPGVLAQPHLYFNAARLDRSVRLGSADYARIARPRVAAIASPLVADQDYRIRMEPLFGTLETMDVNAVIEAADHPWFNQTLVQVGDVLVRVGTFQPGSFHWHQHDDQDEFFFVLDGLLRIELEGRDPVELNPRQAYSVPAGMQHRPIAPVPTSVLMIERAGVRPTGDVTSRRPTG